MTEEQKQRCMKCKHYREYFTDTADPKIKKSSCVKIEENCIEQFKDKYFEAMFYYGELGVVPMPENCKYYEEAKK